MLNLRGKNVDNQTFNGTFFNVKKTTEHYNPKSPKHAFYQIFQNHQIWLEDNQK